MRAGVRDALRVILAVVTGVAAALATAYLSYAEIVPKWATPDRRIVAVTIVCVVAVWTATVRPLGQLRVNRALRRKTKIGAALRALPWVINAATDGTVPVRPLGASAWVIAGFWPIQHLRRVGRERVNDRPAPSKIRWTKGKGVLGQCWKEGTEQIVDTRALHGAYEKCTASEWAALPPEVRLRMSHREFRRISGKYGTVIAVPLTDQDESVIGCLTLDAPAGHHALLSAAEIVEKVAEAARTVSDLIS